MKDNILVAYVRGADVHRQGASFCPSVCYDFTSRGYKSAGTRIVGLVGSDKTGTNDYSILFAKMDSLTLCAEEIAGQITDGFLENYSVGAVDYYLPDGCPVSVVNSDCGLIVKEAEPDRGISGEDVRHHGEIIRSMIADVKR